MTVILGIRDFEKTSSGKYPKYNLDQMNIYVSQDCPSYTAIQVVCNIKSYDLFGKYQDELVNNEKKIVDEKIKDEYGLHNVNIDDLVDWDKFKYNKDNDNFEYI